MTSLRWAGSLLVAAAAITIAGCSSSSHPSSTVVTSPSTTTPSTTAGASGSGTSLMISGVGPGVEETPFYDSTTVASVQCGLVPGGVFVEVHIPADPADPYKNSAMTEPTVAIVVNGEAAVKDQTGKTLYDQKGTANLTGRQGAMVLSMPNITYISGTGKEVVVGAVNINGNYACPATNVAYPGL